MKTRHLNIWEAILKFIACFICLVLYGCSRPASQAGKILGCPLPASATDIHIAHLKTRYVHEDLLSVAMPHDDFVVLMARGGLKHHSDLILGAWPAALRGHGGWPGTDIPKIPWWTVSCTNDADTYFDTLADATFIPATIVETNIAARYESGHLFFQRDVVKLR